MKVSFDFDDTLDQPRVQEYAKELIDRGIEVHIVTSRLSDEQALPSINWNKDLFIISDKLGIKREHIHFTPYNLKYIFFINNPGFIWHLDDEFQEIIKFKKCKTDGISVKNSSFIHKCNRLIKKWKQYNTIKN